MVGSENKRISFETVCRRAGPDCMTLESALSFVEDSQHDLIIDDIRNNTQLLSMIQSGQGSIYRGSGTIVDIMHIFGGVTPENIT